jgi:hypothetical protein
MASAADVSWGRVRDQQGGVGGKELVMTDAEVRTWRIIVDDTAHVLELGPDSDMTDRPTHARVDGSETTIKWRRTTSWWRDWNVGRWRWDFRIGTHDVALICERRQPGFRTRLRAATGAHVIGAAGMGGVGAGAAAADVIRRIRRTTYSLEVDGKEVPGLAGSPR